FFLVGQVLEGELGGDDLAARSGDIHVDGFFIAALRDDAHRLDLVAMRIFYVLDGVEDGLLGGGNARGEISLPEVAVMGNVFSEQAGLACAPQLIVVPSDDSDDRENKDAAQDSK